MNDLYASGSILILFFSGISGSAVISNNYDHCAPVEFKDNRGYVRIDRPLKKSELLNDYMFLLINNNYITKYKMYC